jgi:hypothetical protein
MSYSGVMPLDVSVDLVDHAIDAFERQHARGNAQPLVHVPCSSRPTTSWPATRTFRSRSAREQEKASPLSGTWTGPASAFSRLDVSAQVTAT